MIENLVVQGNISPWWVVVGRRGGVNGLCGEASLLERLGRNEFLQ